MFTTNTWLWIVCAMMTNAVLFGAGAVTVLSVPALLPYAKYLIPAVVVLSFALAPFVARLIAPRMRLRNWGREAWRRGDGISG